MTNTLIPPFARLTHLGDMPVETFLRDYWQQKPLLIRQAFPNFTSPISPDELAGYTLEDDIVSRLVIQGKTATDWAMEHGPLPESRFASLPEKRWTLLVQHADLLDPEINAILEAFRFIPNWRLDDIMISYAPEGGSVGPHFDYYDVFLLQAQGKRRWRIGQACDADSPLIGGIDLQILEQFEATEDWIVEPGDLLYIPPNIAHWGESQSNDCMTYSVGFRAPSHSDMLLDFAEEMASLTTEDIRYSDKGLPIQSHSGEITPEAITKIAAILNSFSNNQGLIANWFGTYMTRPNVGGDTASQGDLEPHAITQHPCKLSPFARCAFYQTSDHCVVFINGEKWHCSKTLALQLSNNEPVDYNSAEKDDQYVLQHLAEEGFLEKVN